MYALVNWCLPIAQGTSSTLTPHRLHSTRLMLYSKNTAKPQIGMNSKRRWGSWS